MSRLIAGWTASVVLLSSTWAFAEEEIAPLVTLEFVRIRNDGDAVCLPGQDSYQTGLVIRTAEAAADHFTEEFLATLNETIDWEEQYVVVFAWHGGYGDRIETRCSEDATPVNVEFHFRGAHTRASGQYNAIYALRNDVNWSYDDPWLRNSGVLESQATEEVPSEEE